MNRRAQRRIDMDRWYSDIGLRIAEIMEVEVQKSGNFIAIWGGNDCYQVNINRTHIAQVDLDKKTCTCKRWNLTAIPYCHAMAAIYDKNEDPVKYVDIYYKKETYLKIYVNVIHGIRMERYRERSNIPPLLPPTAVKQAGRPKKLRIKAVSEIPANLRKIARVYK